MGKKKKAELDKQYATFHDGMISNGYSGGAIKALWDILLPFSDYAFNKGTHGCVRSGRTGRRT